MNLPDDSPEMKQEIAPAHAAGAVLTQGYTEGVSRYAREYAGDPVPGGLLEYWNILRRRRGAVLLFAFVGLALAVMITLPQTPIYQARASLEIQTMNEDFMNMRQVNPVSNTASDFNTNDIQTHIKLLQSEALLERVVKKMTHGAPPKLSSGTSRIATWRRYLNFPEPVVADQHEQALAMARASLKLRAAGQTRVVEILCDSTDPRLAAEFATTLGNEYIDQSLEARWQMNQRTSDWLERQLEEMRFKLERSEDQLQRYARQTGLLFTGDKDKQNVSEEKLRQLQAELSKAQADRIAKQSRYEMAQTSAPEALPDVLNDDSLREYQSKLTDLRRQEAELTATYKPEYSKVQKVRAQIVALETALTRERKDITERIQNDYLEALRREKLLSADYSTQATLVTAESEKSIQYNILKREVDTTRQLYEGLNQRVKEASIASAMRASNVRIVDAAKVPQSPYKPNLIINGLLGLMTGLFLGVAFVVVRERADRTLQAPGDAQFYLNLPELGVVPGARPRRVLRYRMPKPVSIGTGAAAAGANGLATPKTALVPPRSTSPLASTTGENATPEQVELITLQRGHSLAAESFRVVLTSLLFSGENGDRPRVLAFTSAGPGEGKTTVTSNLALAIAEIRQRVLVIDADLRRPRLHTIFNLPNERGLTTLLQARELTDEVMLGIVQETPVHGLYLLPAGPSAGSGLLYSPRLKELLKRFKNDFDMVLIDTPPMLQMPDARVVGRLAEAVVMVIRAGATTRDAAVAVRERLAEDGTRVLGTILNDWDPKKSPNGYYGYSDGYGYYRGSATHYYQKTKGGND